MNLIKTKIKDLLIIEPRVFADGRGYFFESYNKKKLEDLIGKEYNFVQDNESRSSYGVIRWLQYQLAPFRQAKIVGILEAGFMDMEYLRVLERYRDF